MEDDKRDDRENEEKTPLEVPPKREEEGETRKIMDLRNRAINKRLNKEQRGLTNYSEDARDIPI